MNLENNIDQICNELTLKIETLRRVFKKRPQGSSTFSSENAETDRDKERGSLKKTVREAIFELEQTKKHFKSKTIKEVKEKLIKALKE